MKLAVALLPMVALLACSAPSGPVKAEPTVNQQQIVDRFTHDIWPATSAYNADHSQGGGADAQFHAIMDPNLRSDQGVDAYGKLRDAAQKLGRQGEYDRQTRTSHSNEGLMLGRVDVQPVQDNAATLNVCYTYTHAWYVDVHDIQHAPGASEATFRLVKVTDTWYLHSITDDHVVPGCEDVNS